MMRDSERDRILNMMRGGTYAAWSPFLALLDATASSSGALTEMSYSGYARQAVAFDAPFGPGDASGRTVQSNADVEFPPFESSSNIIAVALFDAVSGGEARHVFNLSPSVPVAAGETPRVQDLLVEVKII